MDKISILTQTAPHTPWGWVAVISAGVKCLAGQRRPANHLTPSPVTSPPHPNGSGDPGIHSPLSKHTLNAEYRLSSLTEYGIDWAVWGIYHEHITNWAVWGIRSGDLEQHWPWTQNMALTQYRLGHWPWTQNSVRRPWTEALTVNTEYGIDPIRALTVNTEYGIDPIRALTVNTDQTGLSGALTVNTENGNTGIDR